MAWEDLKPGEWEEGKEKKNDSPETKKEVEGVKKDVIATLGEQATAYMKNLPSAFLGIFLKASPEKQKLLMEHVVVQNNRILFTVTLWDKKQVLDIPRMPTLLEHEDIPWQLETRRWMSFSNQETIEKLGKNDLLVKWNMYAAMAKLMPAGDYEQNKSNNAIWQLCALLNLPKVGRIDRGKYVDNGLWYVLSGSKMGPKWCPPEELLPVWLSYMDTEHPDMSAGEAASYGYPANHVFTKQMQWALRQVDKKSLYPFILLNQEPTIA